MSSPVPEPHHPRLRWLLARDGRWQALQPMHLLTTLHAAARRAGEKDPIVIQEIAESIWQLLSQEWQHRRVVTEAEWHERLVVLLENLGRGDWARWLPANPAEGQTSADTAPSTVTASACGVPSLGLPVARTSSVWQEVWRCGLESCARQALETLIPEPLADWHRQQCLKLHGVYHPGQLCAACVPLLPRGPQRAQKSQSALARVWPIFEYLEQLRAWIGQALILPMPEWDLLPVRMGEVPAIARELALASRYLGLRIVLHLNLPNACGFGSCGPLELFQSADANASHDHLAGLRQALLEALHPWLDTSSIQIIWHVSDDDGLEEQGQLLKQLCSVAHRAAVALGIRPFPKAINRAPTVGSEALLAIVGISLPHLFAAWDCRTPEQLQRRCQSLTKLVMEWLCQWRERLRSALLGQLPPFVLEQAHALLYLEGLEAISETWFPSATERWRWIRQLALSIRATLTEAATQGAPRCYLLPHCPSLLWPAGAAAGVELAGQDCLRVVRHEEDWTQLRAYWQQLAGCFDDAEWIWYIQPPTLASLESGWGLLQKLKRCPTVSRIWLHPPVEEQPALFENTR